MGDIAAVIQRVLASSKPGTNPDGTVSKARCVVDPRTRAEARNRVKALLDQFPVYPQLDLQFMKEAFCGE